MAGGSGRRPCADVRARLGGARQEPALLREGLRTGHADHPGIGTVGRIRAHDHAARRRGLIAPDAARLRLHGGSRAPDEAWPVLEALGAADRRALRLHTTRALVTGGAGTVLREPVVVGACCRCFAGCAPRRASRASRARRTGRDIRAGRCVVAALAGRCARLRWISGRAVAAAVARSARDHETQENGRSTHRARMSAGARRVNHFCFPKLCESMR